jgi:hypothetical protein
MAEYIEAGGDADLCVERLSSASIDVVMPDSNDICLRQGRSGRSGRGSTSSSVSFGPVGRLRQNNNKTKRR